MSIPTNLRTGIDLLDREGGLVRIKRQADPVGEVTAVMTALEDRGDWSAVLFESIKGYEDWRIAGSVFSDRSNVAAMLGADRGRLVAELSDRLAHPVPTTAARSAPVQEVVLAGDDASLDHIPLVWHHERDAGRYISMGLTFVRDPDTGKRNVGIYRFMQRDARTLVPSLTSISNIADIFRRQEARNEPLDIAIVPSASPALTLAASYRAALGTDECTLAGGLQKAPVELIPALTVDADVPADAEVVIEARIRPGERHPEAPFADMSGSYSRVKHGPLVVVSAITRRTDPILQLAFSGHPDATNMAAIGHEIAIWRAVQASSSNVAAVHVPASGYGFHCYMAIRKEPTVEGGERGEQRNVMLAALGAVPQLKLVIAFDHDVDIFNEHRVLGALARRFQAVDPRTGRSRLTVIGDAKGATYDPSSFHREYPNSKLMVDATIPSDLDPGVRAAFEEARPGWHEEFDLDAYLS
ncbi:MAG: UbiD family decarboxylase [bacterium]|nr:UbiD family decarboxylase [bacterium]MDE0289603.1 UbiD family decarboxylase [bacterium]MDE0440447.1 UbiD family decarboxylase [bacterium]